MTVLYLFCAAAAVALVAVLAVGPALVATRCGYTWSLLIWIVPSAAIMWWFLASPDYAITRKKAFGWAAAYLALNGFVVDFFFGHRLFRFTNPNAVVGLYLPGFSLTEFRLVTEHPFPVEELFFYLFGFICILLFYIWSDEYWLSAYHRAVPEDETHSLRSLIGFHWKAGLAGAGLVATATLARQFLNPSAEGLLPLYLTLQVVLVLVPGVTLLGAVSERVNWRAFSFTLALTLFISILYEVTLGLPGGWWAFKDAAMIGVYIESWPHMPVEEVCLWFAAAFIAVIVYETIALLEAKSHR